MFNIEQVFQALLELNRMETVNRESTSGNTIRTFDAISSNIIIVNSSNNNTSSSTLINNFNVFNDPFIGDFFFFTSNIAPFVPFNFSHGLSKSNSHNAVLTLRNILIKQSFNKMSGSNTVDH